MATEGTDAVAEMPEDGSVVGTAVIDGLTFFGKAVQYIEVDGRAMFEGDIMLGQVEQVKARTDEWQRRQNIAAGVGITGAQYRWPDCTVPYVIDPSLPNQSRITDAIDHWRTNTHLSFVERTSANASQYPDYVEFKDAGGCWSYVGRQGGAQTISIGGGCSMGNAIHEIGHAVGLWHEQSREDRDSFVTINWANIISGRESNFAQHITDGDDLGAYDYGSIMHYPRNAFSNGGGDTIVPTTAGVTIGQRTGLSAGDIAAVQAMYPGCSPVVKPPWNEPIKQPWTEPIKPVWQDVKRPWHDPVKPIWRDTAKRPQLDKIKNIDDVKSTQLDKMPGGDQVVRPPLTRIRPTTGTVSPFVLSTGHHAGVGDVGSTTAALAQQLSELAAAIAAGAQDLAMLEQAFAETLAAYQQASAQQL